MRRILSIVGVAMLLVVATGCDLFNWPQYGANGGQTGQVGVSLIDSGSVSNLHSAWTVASPNVGPANLAVENGTVFAASPLNAYTITLPFVPPPPPLEARSTSDGSLRWSAGGVTITDNFLTCINVSSPSAPVVASGAFDYLGWSSDCSDPSHELYGCGADSVDAATGASTVVSSGADGCDTTGPAAADDGTVYVVRTPDPKVFESQPPPQGSGPAVFGSDGSMFVPPANTPAVASLSKPAVDTNSLYTVTDTGQLLAFDRSTHEVQWSAAVGASSSGPPSVTSGRVFVTTGSATEAFDATTGAQLWSTPLPDTGSLQAPAATNSQVFVRTGTTLVALDAATGAVQWEGSLGAASVDTFVLAALGSPSIANDVVFVGTQDGRLLAFATNPTACAGAAPMCTPIWSATLSGPTDSSRPAITHDAVYISAENGTAGSQVYKFGF